MKERIDFILASIRTSSSLQGSITHVDVISQNEYSFVVVVSQHSKKIRITTSLHHLDLPWELLVEVKSPTIKSQSAQNLSEDWSPIEEKYYLSPNLLNDDKELRKLIEVALQHNLR